MTQSFPKVESKKSEVFQRRPKSSEDLDLEGVFFL